MKKMFAVAVFGAMISASAFAQSWGPTGTTNLNVTIAAEAAIRVDTANTNLTSAGSFADFTGTTNYSYKIRTTTAGGAGAVVVKISTDFPGALSVTNNNLSYTCGVTAPASGTATACSGSTTASTSDTGAATFGANTHSATTGTTGNSVAWTLLNDPSYPTGSYTAVATFTISAS
jgi:hypothetical protein